MNLVEYWDVNPAQVFIKFEPSLKASTITNSRFSLYLDNGTPTLVTSDPFETIDVAEDYESIGKILALTWKSGVLDTNTDYYINLSGFRNANNILIEDDTIPFSTDDDITPDDTEIPVAPPVIEYEDHTLVDDPIITIDSTPVEDDDDEDATPSTLSVIEVDPINGDYYLPEDYNYGRAVIKFNTMPSVSFVNRSYFRAQRKPIARTPSRWESVEANISYDADRPWVYVDFPSNDATPVYRMEDGVYFEENYKYRVIVSKDITT